MARVTAPRLGRFRLIETLGSGGAAVVWRATHDAGGAEAAVKVLAGRYAAHPAVRSAFAHEIRALARLDHPAIATVFDLGNVDRAAAEASKGALPQGAPWLALELASGGSLADDWNHPTSWEELETLLHALLGALAHAHARGVLHRDLKPPNLLVRTAQDGRQGPMIADFGIAAALGAAPPRGLERAGTPKYCPPEQLDGDWRSFGPWTDLYALGATAWRLVSGGGERRGALAPRFDVPQELEPWLRRMLAPDPLRRFRCAAEARQALPRGRRRGPRRWPLSAPMVAAGLPLLGLRQPPTLGRTDARRRLRAALRAVEVAGTPRTAAVIGPAGVGRSTLLRWLGEEARESGVAEVIELVPTPDSSSVEACLRKLLRLDASAPADTLDLWEQRLPAQLRSDLQQLRGPGAIPAVSLLTRVVAALSDERPVLVIMDDADRDAAPSEFLRAVTRSGAAVLAVLSYTRAAPGYPAPDVEIRIRRQSARQLARCLGALLPLEPTTALALAGQADGRVAFARDQLEAAVQQDALERRGAQWALKPQARPSQAGVTGVLFTALGEDGRALGALAALAPVAARQQWREACAVLGVREEDSEHTLQSLLLQGAVEEHDDVLLFVNPSLRDQLLDELAERGIDRKVHAACAEVFSGRADGSPATALRAGHHLRRAGRREAARQWLRRAAEQYRDAEAFALAIPAYDELIACTMPGSPDWFWARRMRNSSYGHSGSVRQALDDATDLAARAARAGARAAEADALRMRATWLLRLARKDEALAIARRAVKVGAGTEIEGGALLILAHALGTERPREKEETLHKLVARCRARGDASMLATARMSLAHCAWFDGRRDRARTLATLVVDDPHTSGNSRRDAHLILGDICREAGDLDGAIEHLRAAIRGLHAHVEGGASVALGFLNLAMVELQRDRPAAAHAWLEAIGQAFGAIPRFIHPFVDVSAAAVAAELGDLPEVEARLLRVEAALEEPSFAQRDTLYALERCRDACARHASPGLQAQAERLRASLAARLPEVPPIST